MISKEEIEAVVGAINDTINIDRKTAFVLIVFEDGKSTSFGANVDLQTSLQAIEITQIQIAEMLAAEGHG